MDWGQCFLKLSLQQILPYYGWHCNPKAQNSERSFACCPCSSSCQYQLHRGAPGYVTMILRSTLIRAHNTVVSLHHEDALRQEKHVRATRQVNDGVISDVFSIANGVD